MISRLINKTVKYVFGDEPGGEKVRYLVVGGLTTLVNFGLFVILNELLKIDGTVSNVTSISVSILFAYVANKLIVFRLRSENFTALATEFFKFVGSRLFTMALEVGLVLLFANVLLWNAIAGKALSQVLVIIGNYIISKAIVFRKNDN